MLKQIPEHCHSWNLLPAPFLKGQGVNIVKIIEIGKLKFLHNKWRERVLIISAMIFKLQFKTVIENHSSYFVRFLIFVCLWTNHFVTNFHFYFFNWVSPQPKPNTDYKVDDYKKKKNTIHKTIKDNWLKSLKGERYLLTLHLKAV